MFAKLGISCRKNKYFAMFFIVLEKIPPLLFLKMFRNIP